MVEQQSFLPPWWLRNKHIQSVYANLIKPKSTIDLKWEEMTLPDGDFVDLAWAGPAPSSAPILVLLHGSEGSAHSHYIQEMINIFAARDWRVVVMHFRSCSGRLNRSSHFYNAAYTGDLEIIMDKITTRYPGCPLFSMGFSLGGNILLHYLVKNSSSPIKAAIAVSMPFELAKSAEYLLPFYQNVLLRSLRKKIEAKIDLGMEMPITKAGLKAISTLREFDTRVTTPLYNYTSVDEYYAAASSRHLLQNVEHPLLIFHAMDDPFVPPNSVPDTTELSDSVHMEISQHGGHMGFIRGGLPWKPSYWFAQRILSFFDEAIL